MKYIFLIKKYFGKAEEQDFILSTSQINLLIIA